MKKNKIWAFLAALAIVTAGAFAQQNDGKVTTVNVKKAAAPEADLVISDVQWLPPQPLTDESEFLKTVSGVGKAGARLATLAPRLFVAAVTSSSGPKQHSSATQGVVVSPVMRIKVRNNGKERWASKGEVHVRIFLGKPNEIDQPGAKRPLIAQSKKLLQLSALPIGGGSWMNDGTYLVSLGAIPGSIGPNGDESDVQVAFLHGMTHKTDRLARYRFRMQVDKYYTARVEITAQGEDRPANNGADFVFRLAPNGAAVEGKMVARRTDASGIKVKSKAGPK